MGWNGSGASASSKVVYEKVSQFRRNMRRRNKGADPEVTTVGFREGSDLEQQGVNYVNYAHTAPNAHNAPKAAHT